MRRAALPLVACLVLAGCFGLPVDSVRTGDLVHLRVEANDPASGLSILDMQLAPFPLGEGPLPEDVSAALRAARAGDVVKVQSRGDASIEFAQDATWPLDMAPEPRHQQLALGQFTQRHGAPAPGSEHPSQGPFGFAQTLIVQEVVERRITGVVTETDGTLWLEGTAEETVRTIDGQPQTRTFDVRRDVTGQMGAGDAAFTEGDVSYRIDLAGETRIRGAHVFGALVAATDEEHVTYRIEPVEGMVMIAFQSGAPNPLRLTQGTYHVASANSTHMVIQYHPSQVVALHVRPLDFTVTVLDVEHQPVSVDPKQLGRRTPQLEEPESPARHGGHAHHH